MCRTKEQKCKVCAITFIVCLCTSLALIIGGFFVPPIGVIDGFAELAEMLARVDDNDMM